MTDAAVWRGYSEAEIESQYFLRGLRPDYEVTVIPDWIEASATFRASATCELDIPYGPTPRSALDYFPAGDGAPFVLYVHGGYWQRGDRSVYSFLAEPFVRSGISMALISYDLCPDVELHTIAPQVRRAVTHLWTNREAYGIRAERFSIMGHSAGGHLTAEMALTDWPTVDASLPADLVHAAIPLSGIYDFEPILWCSENERLRLTPDTIAAVSPLRHASRPDAPMLIGYGELEPPDMHRQSHLLATTYRGHRPIETMEVPGVDHFDILNVLADDTSELFSKAAALIR